MSRVVKDTVIAVKEEIAKIAGDVRILETEMRRMIRVLLWWSHGCLCSESVIEEDAQ